MKKLRGRLWFALHDRKATLEDKLAEIDYHRGIIERELQRQSQNNNGIMGINAHEWQPYKDIALRANEKMKQTNTLEDGILETMRQRISSNDSWMYYYTRFKGMEVDNANIEQLPNNNVNSREGDQEGSSDKKIIQAEKAKRGINPGGIRKVKRNVKGSRKEL